MKKFNFLKRFVFCAFLSVSGLNFFSCNQEGDTEYIYKNTFTVTFDANGGYGEMESQTFEQGKNQLLSKNNFTAPQSGRTFLGWATSSTAAEKEYSDEQGITVSKNLVLYAVWGMKSGNGGDASESQGWPDVQTDFKSYKFNAYRDTSIKPGDDFFNYSLGKWVNSPSTTGVWKITSYNDKSLYPDNTYTFTDSDTGDTGDKGVMNNQETFGNELAALVWNKYKNSSDENIIKTLDEKFPGETDKTAALKLHINEIDAADTAEKIYEIIASDITEGFSTLLPEISCKERKDPFINLTTNEDLDGLLTDIRENKISTFSQILQKMKMTDSAAEIKEILGITGDENAKEEDFAAAFTKVIISLNNADLTAPDDNITDRVADKLGIDSVSFIADKGCNLKAFTKLLADDNRIDTVKRYQQFSYLLTAYDFVDSKSSVYDFLPVRMIMLKEFRDNFDKDGTQKKSLLAMCEEFRAKFIERLENNTWMSDSSKKAAKEKAESMFFAIGYPDKFSDEILFEDKTSTTATTFLAACGELYKEAVKRYFNAVSAETDPTKRFEYMLAIDMAPLKANALYEPTVNGCLILATNLIDPIYNTEYADAYNYATIGATTIGHEMCHAFDASGSKHDKNGKKTDWWAISDKLRFEEKKNQMTELFNMFTTPSSYTSLNGEKTLTENMADFGGLVTAYDIFIEKKINEGFSGDRLNEQRKMFFQSYALAWSEIPNDENMKTLIEGDVHAPNPYRTNGNVCQMDDWYDLYDVQKGNKYYLEPGQRIVLW